MAIVLTKGGSLLLLGAQRPYLLTLTLRLFQNDHAPTEDDDVTAFVECNFPGYAPVPVAQWGNPFVNAAGKAEIVEEVHIFTCTGPSNPNTVRGYYLTDQAGNLVWVEYGPPGGQPMDAAGKAFLVRPSLTDRTDPG